MGNKISGTIGTAWYWISDELTASEDRLAFTVNSGGTDTVMMAFNSQAYVAVLQDIATCMTIGYNCDFSNAQEDLYLCNDGDTTSRCSTPGWGVNKGDSYYILVMGESGTEISGNYYFYNTAAVVICSIILAGLLALLGCFLQRRRSQPPKQNQPAIVMVQTPTPQQPVVVQQPLQNQPVVVQQGNVV